MKKFMFIALTAIMFTLTACDGNKAETTYGAAVSDTTAVDSMLADSIDVLSTDSVVTDTICVDSVK